MDMLVALMKGGLLDHVIHSRDSFGSTPMDYLCLNRMPTSTKVIRRVLQTRFGHLLGLNRLWKSDMLRSVDAALAVDWSSRRREIVAVYLKLAILKRLARTKNRLVIEKAVELAVALLLCCPFCSRFLTNFATRETIPSIHDRIQIILYNSIRGPLAIGSICILK
eukprot:scaffold18269_cov61-Cylindrotheca_fusiformis.AAC.1